MLRATLTKNGQAEFSLVSFQARCRAGGSRGAGTRRGAVDRINKINRILTADRCGHSLREWGGRKFGTLHASKLVCVFLPAYPDVAGL